jgi:hypothetical protein
MKGRNIDVTAPALPKGFVHRHRGSRAMVGAQLAGKIIV